MKIQVHLYASLTRHLPDEIRGKEPWIEVPEGASVRDLLVKWNVPIDQVKLVFINGIHAELDAVLKAEDRLGVFPPIGGG
ncbi:MAG: MoaD/ThiS family protein [Desulfobacterales bacterium]|jgi:sulfur carrier protein ThiS|nr:MoaD/ThiS family protein [Desulfobacterales bacterium]MDD3081098.1 MoaD/ThiS family protein [Desulfobacterales bacterium]MDD3950211.1 MoaD/ThiS family protein [Desulfobacterales bacterium]MDD4464050.1 MoaD/ThiS family protein [Desulfobacterales bacterium]